MIRLPPTSIHLSEGDVHYHLQRVLLRHALVADFEKLEIDCAYEDEDGRGYLDSPISLQQSCSSSVVLDSGSDIIAEAASLRERSFIDCRYKSSHQDGTLQPEAGSSTSMPQLDGASFIAGSDLNVENVSDPVLSSPHHGCSRLYSIDEAPVAHFPALMRDRHGTGRKKYGSCGSEQQSHSPDLLIHSSPVDTDLVPLFDPAVDSLDLERSCSFKIRGKSQNVTNMSSRHVLDSLISQDKQVVSPTQLALQAPPYRHAAVRKSSMLRFAQSASADSADTAPSREGDPLNSQTGRMTDSSGIFCCSQTL